MTTNNFKLTGYLGTYTNGDSKGIYKFKLNMTSGAIEEIELAVIANNPTYLIINKANNYLYSVTKENEEGGVAAFLINDSTEKLKPINYKVSEGKPPCYVDMDSTNAFLFSANYHKGTIEIFKTNTDGSISSPLSILQNHGSGPDKKRQDSAHAHCVTLTPDESYLCTVDLGTDKLEVYNFSNGILSKFPNFSLDLKPGCGPRHIEFHPSENLAYIITELSSEIIALKYDSDNCSFKEIQYISALPEGYIGESSGGALRISSNGNYLYASNRGNDTIALFKIDKSSGRIELISHTSTEGKHPRDFIIDPTGNFLIVANKDSSDIVSFSIDKSTGMLKQISSPIYVPNPVCIKFKNI